MSGLWGYQTGLDLFLQETGITTLLFAGVNADQVFPSLAVWYYDSTHLPFLLMQCVLGTLVDAYLRGYDCIVLRDAIATTSPEGAYENVIYNSLGVSF